MTTILHRQTTPAQSESQEPKAPAMNVADLGDAFLVRVYVPQVLRNQLVGRKAVGIQPHPQGGGRQVPVFETYTDSDGKEATRFLDKWCAFVLPKEEGVYHLSARASDEKASYIENTYVQVISTETGFSLKRMTYPQLVTHFGGTPLQRQGDGTLTAVPAATQAI